jgi:hypothetical protein
MVNMNVLQGIQRAKRLTRHALSTALWQPTIGTITRRLSEKQEPRFADLVAQYDVVIMKHCFPASDILEDIGKADPTSPRQSLENYQAIYRLLRDKFDKNPNKLFIIWTLPPRHRLFQPSEGHKDANAARATEFSNWLKGNFVNEGGSHPNIFIWDFRGLIVDPDTNFLKYEYESDHNSPDSHPNKLANDKAGPQFSKFTVDSIMSFYGRSEVKREVRIIYLHHSTGLNVYQYPSQGVPAWFTRFNASSNTSYLISHKWYPLDGNMPVNYYRSWLEGR